uniref:FACT complex subunit n=1 Tax=Caenorhabditis japonica TaxID=281687 RepID=A0A8R1HXU7_CAEJA
MTDKKNPVLNKEHFYQRAERLYKHWESGEDGLDQITALAVVYGNSDNPYTKSSAFHSWLLGHEIIDTVLLFLKDHIYVLGSNRKADFFSSVTGAQANDKVPPVTTLLRDKTDKDAGNFEKLISYVSKAGGELGAFSKEKFDSEFVDAWNKALEENDIKKTDVTLAFTHLFSVKDEKELDYVRKSAQVTSSAWTAARAKYVDVIDQEKRVRHSQLSEDFSKYMKDSKIQGNLAKYAADTCYDPIVMSGGNYSFKWNHESSESHLHYQFGSIITSFGARLNDYCSNLTRTMLIFPSSDLEAAYEAILAAEQAVMAALKPGAKLSDVYKVGIDTLTAKNPKLAESLNKKELGFATGIEFRESRLAISPKCEEVVKAGMVFIVYIGADGIPNKSNGEKGKPAAIAISDTVLVKAEGENEVLTEKAKSRLKSNVIRFKEDAEQAGREAEKENEKNKMLGRGHRSVVLNDQTRNKTTNEEKRKERQKELGKLLNEAAKERLSGQNSGSSEKKVKKSNVSYKTQERFPADGDHNRMLLYVDKKYDSIIIPMYGIPVPVHISMVKSCSQTVENEHIYLRINFSVPGSQVGKDNNQFAFPMAKYLKELTFRASSGKDSHSDSGSQSANLTTTFRLIKEMQKRFRTEEAEEREKEGAVKQDKLILSQNKLNPKLKDLLIRPNIIQKRITGSLEAHTNGFRYTSLRGDRIDVLYNNIKHAFFQPCDNEMIILLHFHLKNPVMWGKKKYKDVQFYTEVGEITTDLGKYHHMQDRDDMQSEQQEREMRRRLNAAFNGFCEKVTRLTNEQFDFDTPFSDLGFYGVPYRSSTMLKPTSSCVVNLTEWPPFIVTLSEVELVHFERVSLQLKNFDMVFIFKDYKAKPQMVTQIPMSSIDMIKEWLHSCDIKYSEGIQSLNWANVMRTITDDLEAFFENGGWSFLDLDSDGEGEQEDSDDSDAYSPEEESAGSESESDEDESEGEETEESDDEEASLDSDESEGKEWSDLEEEAARADNRREVEANDGGRDRKRGHSSKGGPSSKRRR